MKKHLALFGIGLLALLLRCIQPGLYIVWIDELLLHNAAIDLARQGVWTWVGNPSAFAGLAVHSPLPTYLLALPYLLSPDPQVARLFVGVLGALTVYLLAWWVFENYGWVAAISAGLLLAVMPQLVEWSRFVWNPNLAQIFIASWLITAHYGYGRGRRGAQIAHWLSLSACVQMQAALITLVPVSLILLVYGMRYTTHLRAYWRVQIISAVLVMLTLIPWAIGLAQMGSTNVHNVAWNIALPNLATVVEQVGRIAGGVNFAANDRGSNAVDGLNTIFYLQTLLFGVGIVAALLGSRHLSRWIALMALWSLVYNLFSAMQVIANFYLMLLALTAPILIGLVINQLWQWRRGLAVGVAALLIGSQGWLLLIHLNWYTQDGSAPYSTLTRLSDLHQQVMDWRNVARSIIFVQPVDATASGYSALEWLYFWKFYEKQGFVRHENTLSIPVATAGEIVVTFAEEPYLPRLFGQGQTLRLPGHAGRSLRWWQLTPADLPLPDITPIGNDSFYGLATVQGAMICQAAPNQWDMWLLWRSFQQTVPDEYRWSAQVASDEAVYVSIEIAALPGYQWRFDELVLTYLPLTFNEQPPSEVSLTLRLLPQTEVVVLPVTVSSIEACQADTVF